tara:strand:+ start:733 stop:1842 length:1110 start_codon:yes stop_codon:yes gene_type:complete
MGINENFLGGATAAADPIYDAGSYTGGGTGTGYCGAGNTSCGTTSTAIDVIPDLFFVKSNGATGGWIVGDSYRGNFNYISFHSNSMSGSGCFSGFPNNPTSCAPAGTPGVGNATSYGATPTSNIVAIDNSPGWWGANKSGQAYMAYGFKGSGGVSATNTDGAVTSTVYADPNGSFSVTGYQSITGASASTYAGVGITPEFAMWKRVDANGDWFCWVDSIGKYNQLNNGAFITDSSNWFNGNTVLQNTSAGGQYWVVYSFASVAGVSKVGTYTGNGSTTGPTITTDFEPAFTIVKNTTSTNGTAWLVQDNVRSTSNPRQDAFFLQTNYAGGNYTNWAIDYNATSFQLKTSDEEMNKSGDVYFYMAFAEAT